MQASKRSVKAHQSFSSIGSSLSTGFQVYLSKCWDPYVSRGCMIWLVFFCSISTLFRHVNLVTTSLLAGSQVYLSQPWVLCMQSKAVRYDLMGGESHFWVLCFFLVNCLGGWNQYMWLVPEPDPKCELNFSSFLTLPHLSDCPICNRNSLSIILLL